MRRLKIRIATALGLGLICQALSCHSGFLDQSMGNSDVGEVEGYEVSKRAPSCPFGSGLYETWSPVKRMPVGPLRQRPEPSVLPRWIEVDSKGDACKLTFQPEGRVVWRLEWGRSGLTDKRVEVDGELVSRTRFSYDTSAHLQTKEVTGPGISDRFVWHYETDDAGRVLRRVRQFQGSSSDRSDRWEVRHRGNRIRTERHIDGQLVRLDVFDSRGLPVRTELHPDTMRPAELHYRRDDRGRLQEIRRRIGDREGTAVPSRPDPEITPGDLTLVTDGMPVQRYEVRLLLGAPVTHSDEGSGKSREQTDDYSRECWLNEISSLRFDETGLFDEGRTSCVCGFCVDADLPVDADKVRAVDVHWTKGPWVRLDGRLDVTTDHPVITPDGPRPAGELKSGDPVLRADGDVHHIESVEHLRTRRLRKGRNLRTKSGRFAAGGLLFASEKPRECSKIR